MDVKLLKQLGQSTQILTLSDFKDNPTFRFELSLEENPELEFCPFPDDFFLFRYKFHNVEGDITEISLLTEDIKNLNSFTLHTSDENFLKTRAMPLYLYVIARQLKRSYTISISDLEITLKVNPINADQMSSCSPLELLYVANWSEDRSMAEVRADAEAFVAEMNYQLTMQG